MAYNPLYKLKNSIADLCIAAVYEKNISRTQPYLTGNDNAFILFSIAAVNCTIKTTNQSGHETVVLVTAKAVTGNRYLSKISSNIKEAECPGYWMISSSPAHEPEKHI